MDALDSLDTDLVGRQILGGLGSLLGVSNPTTSGTQAISTSADGLGGVIGAFTSIVDGIPTVISFPLGSSTTPTSIHSSSSSTGSTSSTPSKVSSTIPTTSTSTSSTSISPMTPTSASTPAVTPTLTSPTVITSPIVITSSDSTGIVYVTSYAEITASPTTTPESFLQNGPLEGGVFALVGIVILIIIFVIITFTIRRRRRNRLDRAVADAVTFDPSVAEHYIDEENRMTTAEKHRFSGSSSGHGHGFGYTPQLPYAAPAPAHYAYYDQNQGYEPQAAYPVPLPQVPVDNQDNAVIGYELQAAYPVPLPQVPVNNQDNAVVANTGGANLTRKYSDRKPVPPLLPNPVYDPSRSPVLPSHYYDQENLPPGIALSSNPSAPAANEVC
ncbi:hypothetical protein M405DRAFT_370044 [Rhizopogon salebrosus TDB-379]|nr:hypothetical protein M405DRAFT_370044 [Rhizopogon salebrosus TDB-379]